MIWMSNMKYIKLLILAVIFFSAKQVFALEHVKIILDVNNIPSSKGNIIVYFCQSEEEFISERQSQYSFFFPAKKNKVTAEITLPKGIYGIHIFHDENDNKIIDKNSQNHPIEKFGYSNNFFGSYGRLPDFKNTLIKIDSDKQVIKLNLR